jgi:hypothetical protein
MSNYRSIQDKSIRPKHLGEIVAAQKEKTLGANGTTHVLNQKRHLCPDYSMTNDECDQ